MQQFEFSEEDELLFESFNYRLLAISAIALLGVGTSFFQFIEAVTNDQLLSTLIWLFLLFAHILLAIFFFKPYDNFLKITLTEGNDMEELMTAFEELNFGFIIFLMVDSLFVLLYIFGGGF